MRSCRRIFTRTSIPCCARIDYPVKGLSLDAKLLEILVCPLCKGPLVYKKVESELICKADRLAFPIKDGIPVMLEDEARKLDPNEEA